jgi:cellulose synthase (UDP-forming)
VRTRVRILAALGVPLGVWYYEWLFNPHRAGAPVMYALLVVAEFMNLIQALGFWWTAGNERVRERRAPSKRMTVDVFIPVYHEPAEIVDLTVAAAVGMRGADVRVWLLDDGDEDAIRELATRYGVGYIRRTEHKGAKAGNINHALGKTSAPLIAIFDCDQTPDASFLEATLGYMEDPEIAFVQTAQYYANSEHSRITAAAQKQQEMFYGSICRGKDGLGAMFCCGSNVVLRRTALEGVGGFPTNSLTEDFQLSIHLHELGWKSAYVPEVLASGLGPEDAAAYVSQQLRWARGCLSGIPYVLRAKLPLPVKTQYLLSGIHWLTGWTLLIYLSFPVVRLLGGGQPLGGINAAEFLLHFAPWYALALTTLIIASDGSVSFTSIALSAASFWIHVLASILTVLRRKGSFVVTPKTAAHARQPRAVWPALAAVGILVACCIYGLTRNQSAYTINNVSFAAIHVTLLMTACWPALQKPRAPAPDPSWAAEVAA